MFNGNVFADTFSGYGNVVIYTCCQGNRARTKLFTTFVQANLVRRFAVAGNVDGICPNIVASDAKVVQTAAL